ncbi:MAG TPA: adenosine deaminase [Acidimicrobiales bacterium]|nr:adenosine deaminase [Acidimicrobiales bacterium]
MEQVGSGAGWTATNPPGPPGAPPPPEGWSPPPGTAGAPASSNGPAAAAKTERAWIAALPKAEVHLHLEGCLRPEQVVAAARRHGVDPNAAAGYARAAVTSLPQLIAYLDWSCSMIDRPDDLAMLAFDTSRFAWASGTRHVDVLVSPSSWSMWQGRLAPMVDAIDAGFRAAEHDGFATATVCLSLKRSQTRFEAQEIVDWILELRHPRVSGLSVEGDESRGSHNERFIEAFARIREAGLRRCAHAGESSGARGVWEAMTLLGAERIDHGIRSLEDRAVVTEIVDRRVALDVCPTSNVTLGLVPDLARHPIETLRRSNVRVSVNTDDPQLFGIDLAGEYVRCATAFGWGRDVLTSLARTSIESCFADDDRRSALLAELEAFAHPPVPTRRRPAPPRS